MSESSSPAALQDQLEQLLKQLSTCREEARQVEEQIAREQAEVSRNRQQDRRRAQVNRSATLPALQIQRQRLRAELFRLEQEVRTLRERLGESV